MNSPFTIVFGEKPNNLIKRPNDFNNITSIFDSGTPETKIITITGPRGCGKTVLLTSIKNYYDEKDNWITVDVNPNDDILEQIAAKIYESGKLKKLFLKAEFNFSFKGIGFSIQGQDPVSSIYILLEKMFKYLKDKDKRILITIDDVSNTEFIKKFASSYQSFIRESYPIFLLMTGLYENVEKIEKNKNLTFLARTPKIYLDKLNLRAITLSYMDVFNISQDDAIKLAKQTNGYAYGFQLLGSILYKNNKTKVDKDVLSKYDLSLEDNAYSLMWDELSNVEKNLLFLLVKYNGQTKEMINNSDFNNSSFQVYKKRLTKKGIVDDSLRGKLSFSLPRFKEFVEFQMKLEE